MSACDVPFSVARLLGPLLVLGWPEPARAPELRRMQGAGDARLTVEPKGSVGVDCGARGAVCAGRVVVGRSQVDVTRRVG